MQPDRERGALVNKIVSLPSIVVDVFLISTVVGGVSVIAESAAATRDVGILMEGSACLGTSFG